MNSFLVRVEAVNLQSWIFDSNDLSTIRGGSFAGIEVPKYIIQSINQTAVTIVFIGASQALAIVDAGSDKNRADIERELQQLCAGIGLSPSTPPDIVNIIKHLTVLAVAVPYGGDFRIASAQAATRLRQKQLSFPTIETLAPPSPTFQRPCAIDKIRPASDMLRKGETSLVISKSVSQRRKLGLQSRRSIYGNEIGVSLERQTFIDSFHELTQDNPNDLPPSLSGKMAIVKLDGNKFTAMRDAWIASATDAKQAAKDFSEFVIAARRAFLNSLVQMAASDAKMKTESGKLKLETLIWGGDETTFVIPAWKTLDLLALIARDMSADHWQSPVAGRLTTTYGILICNVKTPIATGTKLVESMVSDAKTLNEKSNIDDLLTLQIIESIEAPSGNIRALRNQLYTTDEAKAFTISGASGLDHYLKTCAILTDQSAGLPRSQLQNLLRKGRQKSTPLNELIEDVTRRARASTASSNEDNISLLKKALQDPILGHSPHNQLLPYQRLTELWDLLSRASKSDNEVCADATI